MTDWADLLNTDVARTPIAATATSFIPVVISAGRSVRREESPFCYDPLYRLPASVVTPQAGCGLLVLVGW